MFHNLKTVKELFHTETKISCSPEIPLFQKSWHVNSSKRSIFSKHNNKTLEKFKNPNFKKWIQMLYSSQQASVKVNGYRSKAFPLQHGCRQGCALFPLLFATSIEPLAQRIRDDNIKGVIINGEEHKICYMQMMSCSI